MKPNLRGMTAWKMIEHNSNPRNVKLFTKAELPKEEKENAWIMIKWNENERNVELFSKKEFIEKIPDDWEVISWNQNKRNEKVNYNERLIPDKISRIFHF